MDARVVDATGAGPYRFSLRFSSAPGLPTIVRGASSAEMNDAVGEATADVLILALPGVSVDDGTAVQLAGWLHDPSVVAVGPMFTNGNGSVMELGWIVSGSRSRPYGRGHRQEAVPFLEVAREVSAVGGAAFAVRRSDFVAAGGLNPSLPVHAAGVEMTHRLARLRRGVCIAEPAVIVDAGSLPLPSELAMPTPHESTDPFISPHTTTDGMTIDSPPPAGECRERTAPRVGDAPQEF